MNEIDFIRSEAATEREHLAEIRRACAATLDNGRNARAADMSALCQACAEYLLYVATRLDAQDETHCRQLRARVAAEDSASRAVLDAAAKLLADSRAATARLGAALHARQHESLSPAAFIEACRAYLAAAEHAFGAEREALGALATRYCGVADWRRAARVDADSILEHRRRYAAARAALTMQGETDTPPAGA